MSRTIQEIIAELEANRDEARAQRKAAAEKRAELSSTLRAAIEAQDAALKSGDLGAYTKATQERAFAEEKAKNFNEPSLPYYTAEQVNAYYKEINSAEKAIFQKHAERVLPLIDQIRSLEKEASMELSTLRRSNTLILGAMNCMFDSDLPRGYRLPSFYGVILLLPDLYQDRMQEIAKGGNA